MAVTWPDDIPATPLYEGFQELPPRVTLRTNMDSGPVKVRRRYTANVRPIKVRFWFTDAELALFDVFFIDIAESGAVPFLWTHPRTAEEVLTRFAAEPRYTVKAPDVNLVEVDLEILP